MSKFKNRLMKRALALILSGAMIMSDAALYQMTAFATEETTEGYSERPSEEDESEAAEITVKEDGDSDEKDADNAADMAEDDKNNDAADSTADDDKNNDAADNNAADDAVPETVAESTEDADNTDDSDEKVADSESAVDDAAVDETTVEDDPQEAEVEEIVEEETSDVEVTEEVVDNQASSANIKGGFKKGTEYGDSILKFFVLEDMNYKGTSDIRVGSSSGTKYSDYVAGSSNPYISQTVNDKGETVNNGPNNTNGWIPTMGAAFKIEATKASKITFVVGKGTNKTYYYAKDDGEKGAMVKSGALNETYATAASYEMDAGETYYFYVSGSKPYVYSITWEEIEIEIDEDSRKPWEDIANPEISKVGYKETDPSKIEVTVDSVVGLDGADTMTVYMYNAEDTENAIATVVSEKYQDSTTVTFAPTASGTYVFKAEIARKKRPGEEKTGELSEPFEFECPFVPPANLSAENLGGGNVQVKWDAVPGVDKYVVEIVDKANLGNVIPSVESVKTSTVIFGLTKGNTYTFTVYSVKVVEETEQKSEPSESIDHKVADLKVTYSLSRYGNGAGKTGNDMKNNTDTSVRLVSSGGKGKIVPASTDGLMFYYTTVSSKKNFTFTALAHVNSWEFSNGQEGFGVMAADRVGSDGTGSEFWNNSYQAVVSRVSYRWDGVGISEDDTGEKIEMQIGVGSTEKVGVTQDDLSEMSAGDITVPRNFSAVQTAIDSTYAKYGAGQYNIVANCTNIGDRVDLTSRHEEYVNFELQVQKNNTGYFVSYTKVDNDGNYILDSNGNKITTTKKYYDPDALSKLTKGSVYVGVFTSRHADVTFSNMTLETIDPEDDLPAEEIAVKYYNLTTSILSQTVSNSEDYEFIFHSNWNGKLVLKDSAGKVLSKHTVKGDNGEDVEIDYYDVTGSLDPAKQALQDGFDTKNTKIYIDLKDENALSIGKNVFTVEYTPDKSWCPDEDKEKGKRYAELNSYDKVTLTYTVEYRKYGEPGQTIYVSQYGKSSNTGTKDSPLDIYTAVKYAQPGQTILLAGGTYRLNKTLQTPRGVDGKPDIVDGKETYKNYIKMMAEDPTNRPVLDFMSLVPAVVTVGNYWYFKNIDVTRCKDGEKGIQVSSSYCVFDRVDTYKNGSTGLQISRLASQDTYKDWPHDNLILNCNSYLNVDSGYEDADGFAAKLTSGSNNVFDGCIAAFNADDGWDLFAKVQSGSIGGVTIKNSIAYRNGYVFLSDVNDSSTIDENGTLVKGKGNGNGFKMGGDGVIGGSIYDTDENGDNYYDKYKTYMGHRLYNSYSFCNKAKGFDSNSCPNVKAYNSVSFNNGDANIGFSTASKNANTDYEVKNVISFRTDGSSTADSISGKGSQSSSKIKNATSYLWNGSASKNSSGASITEADFYSVDYKPWDKIDPDYWRNEDGTINMHGFLQLNDKSKVDASMGGTASKDIEVGEDTYGNITGAIESGDATDDYGTDYPEGGINDYYGKIWVAEINYLDYTDREPIEYTGKQVMPELHVYFSADAGLLRKGKDYTVKYENNINAGTATAHVTGVGSYKGFTVDKTFEIKPINVNDYTVSIPESVAVVSGDASKEIKPTWQGKALKKGKDYDITATTDGFSVVGKDNFTGTKKVTAHTVTADKLMSKASVKITTAAKELTYTGLEVKPKCEVKLNGTTLTEGEDKDYTIKYANNIEIGKATLTVVGNGTTYFGSKSVNFNIKGGKIQDEEFVAIEKGTFLTKYEANGVEFNGSDCAVPENTIKLTLAKNPDEKLVNGVDYKIVQKGTNKAGNATVTIKGINNYTGSISYKFKITAKDISTLTDDNFPHNDSLPYLAGGVKYDAGTNFNIKMNGYTVDTKHYTLSYKNNATVGTKTDAKAPTVIVKGRNGFTGKKEFTFTITAAEMTDNTDIVVSAKDIATNGKELKYSDLKKSKITVTQSYTAKGKVKSKKLSAGRDYDKNTIEYYIDKNNNYVIDEGVDEKITEKLTSKDTVSDFTKGYMTVLVRVHSASNNPKCNYKEGYVDGYFRAAQYDINKAKFVNLMPRVYGNNWKEGNGLSVAIDWSDTEVAKIEQYIDFSYKTSEGEASLVCNDRIGDYKKNKSNAAKYYAMDGFVIDTDSYKKNDRVGTASFTIVGTGKYAGTKKVTFKIVSKETAKKLAEKGSPVEALKVNAAK
ncbi:MAG: fibronectin type III domain-containing protein [Lachnospiraceae bacterium]|nr:fibronectin type III domain-containing protein [Lachnospiraceae bacterium]